MTRQQSRMKISVLQNKISFGVLTKGDFGKIVNLMLRE